MTTCEGKLTCTDAVCKPSTAGKLFARSGSVKECFQFEGLKDFENRYVTPSYVPKITHGRRSNTSDPAGLLINPTPASRFQQHVKNLKEQYYKNRIYPLGKVREPIAYKGSSDVPSNQTLYGISTVLDEPAGLLINPPKSCKQVNSESSIGHENYVTTHKDYFSGEMVNRKYNWGDKNPKSIRFGIETPHYNNGKNMAQSLNWMYKNSENRKTYLVSKHLDSYRKRFQPVIGKSCDPMADTLKVGPDHTFGLVNPPDECGVGDLIHMRGEKNFLAAKDVERGWVACIRHHLKQANYHNFNDLKSAFQHYDYDNKGYIDAEKLRDVCWKFNLPIDNKLLSSLMQYCAYENNNAPGESKNLKIDYVKFVNFLNWEDKFYSLLPECVSEHQKIMPTERVKRLQKQIDKAMTNHFTTSSLIGQGVEKTSLFKEKRTFGIPTIRSDLPAPRLRRISDNVNYGDESDVHGLICPSLLSTYGVFERDMFKQRSKDEIRAVFENAGVKMSPKTFEETWQLALQWSANNLTRCRENQVSVEAFRAVLDNAQAAAMRTNEPT